MLEKKRITFSQRRKKNKTKVWLWTLAKGREGKAGRAAALYSFPGESFFFFPFLLFKKPYEGPFFFAWMHIFYIMPWKKSNSYYPTFAFFTSSMTTTMAINMTMIITHTHTQSPLHKSINLLLLPISPILMTSS